MKEYSLVEKLIIIAFDVSSFLTFCFFANLLQGLLVGIFLYVFFCFINSLIPEDKRIHADRLRHCFVLSIFYLITCVAIYKYSLNYMNNISSITLCILLIILASFITTECLWWKPDSNYMDIDEFIKYSVDDIRKNKLKEFETRLKAEEPQLYDIYLLRFKEGYKHYQIQKMLDISGSRLTEKLNRIATSFRVFCK